MILITIKEKIYRENSNIKVFLKDASSALFSSVKIGSDEIPTKGTPGKWVFSRDFTCKLIFIKSTTKTKEDLDKLKHIKLYARNYPTMMYQDWFDSRPPGKYEMRLDFTKALILTDILPIKRTKAKDTLKFNDKVILG